MTQNKIFNLQAPGSAGPHIFPKGEAPDHLFLAVSEFSDSEDGVPQADMKIRYFIDIDVLKGKPYEDEVRALIGLPPLNRAEVDLKTAIFQRTGANRWVVITPTWMSPTDFTPRKGDCLVGAKLHYTREPEDTSVSKEALVEKIIEAMGSQ
jgi:hypothetical protein